MRVHLDEGHGLVLVWDEGDAPPHELSGPTTWVRDPATAAEQDSRLVG